MSRFSLPTIGCARNRELLFGRATWPLRHDTSIAVGKERERERERWRAKGDNCDNYGHDLVLRSHARETNRGGTGKEILVFREEGIVRVDR